MSDDTTTLTDRIDLERPSIPAATTAVLSLAAVCWFLVLEGWLPMPAAETSIDAPMSAPGVPELIGTTNGAVGVGAYLLMWGTMMMAMMLPSMAPAVRRFRDSCCGSIRRIVPPTAAFLGAYALAWTLTGTVPLAVEYLVPIRDLATGATGRLFVGSLLAFAGAYQFTPLKRSLLARCRDCPDVHHKPDLADGVRRGLEHAVGCIGCTWALFALMVALGSMNALVTVGLTLVVSLERLAPDGERYALATGALLLVAAVLTVAIGVPFGG